MDGDKIAMITQLLSMINGKQDEKSKVFVRDTIFETFTS